MPSIASLSLESADRDLEQRIRAYLAARQVPSLNRLRVDARGGVVTLQGRVGSYHAKQLAQQCCRRVAGVIRLIDEVEVVFAIPARSRALALGTLGLAIASFSAGCGKSDAARVPVYPVQGQVSFEGRPATGALVVLHPQSGAVRPSPPARGQVGKDGSFVLSTYDARDGAPAGDYVVTVEWKSLVRNGDEFEAGPSLLPPRYGDPRTSDVRVRVTEGKNQLPPIALRR